MDKKKMEPSKLKMKLSLKRETLRTLTDSELGLLDSVVGGTSCLWSCTYTLHPEV